jgi:hypothetical protein
LAEHDLSFNVMEHLSKLIRSICKDSEIAAGLKSSRTKTTGIINNTIGPSRVVDSFLGLLELENSNMAANIFDCLINHLTSAGIKIKNIAGFAANNCATMMGQALLKNRLPHLVVVGCSSHSFN